MWMAARHNQTSALFGSSRVAASRSCNAAEKSWMDCLRMAHYARVEGRFGEIPPGPERGLRVADVARIAFRTGELVIPLGEPERSFEVLRVARKLRAQPPQLACGRIAGPHPQMLEDRRRLP